MTDLRDRFRNLDSLRTPDLWADIELRSVVAERRRGSPLSWALIMMALLLGLAVASAALIGSGIVKLPVLVDASKAPHMTPFASPSAPSSPSVTSAGTWAATGNLIQARCLFTATLLLSGNVLVSGGIPGPDLAPGFPALAAAEIYDPSRGSWLATSNMLQPRSAHTATLLPDGRVLVAGGYADFAALNTAELYDPATGSWMATGKMIEARGYHTATLLSDGTVLVAGGRSNDSSTGHALDSAELFDPITGTWTATGSMSLRRTFHTATLLPNGKVLVVGAGVNGVRVDLTSTAELYDPTTGIWTATGIMTSARVYHTATLLPNGRVLVAGGYDSNAGAFQAGSGSVLDSAETYDPSTGLWTVTGRMTEARAWHTATLLPDGRVLITGGHTGESGVGEGTSTSSTGKGLASVELYDAITGIWVEGASLASERELQTAALLIDRRVLVAGGSTGGSYLASAELFSPSTGR